MKTIKHILVNILMKTIPHNKRNTLNEEIGKQQ